MTQSASTVTLSPSTKSLASINDTVTLAATVKDAGGTTMSGATVTWTTSSSSIATVSSAGLVTAVANGTATITATSGSASGTASVTVTQSASTVTLSSDSLTFTSVGDTATLAATVKDAGGTTMSGATVTWTTSSSSIATVSSAGLVTAVANGTATITATSGSASGTASVTVTQSASTVTLSSDSLTFTSVGDTATLAATVKDAGGTTMSGATVTWVSSDTTVATVSSAGLVTAVANGTATITATSGSASATTAVTVDLLLVEFLTGSGQTVRTNSAVPIVPTVRVRRTSGTVAAGVLVTFSVTAGGGLIGADTATTNESGVASVGSWNIGSTKVTNTIKASAPGAGDSNLNVTARYPYWTMMVYLAADNNLASAGFKDIEEMEAAGYDPEVQVVMQAEFNPGYMSQANYTLAGMGLSSWNTFRYAIGDDTRVSGKIDGQVSYATSAVDMSDPANLTDFVQWAQSTYPSERSILVPWNHGGGYIGLVQDLTDGGSDMMTLTEFKTALQPLPKIDIIDFDMCLMAGYTTLAQLDGQAEIAVFSQELVPGDGLPYTRVLDGIQGSPTASTEAVAGYMVEKFYEDYNGGRFSITKSAYSLAGLSALETAIGNLATLLNARITNAAWRSLIQAVLINSQRYKYQELKDIVNFAQLFKANTTDTELIAGLDALISAATSTSFRLANRAYTASGNVFSNEPSVDGSWGLSFTFPAGVSGDNMQVLGSRSLATYQGTMPSNAWTTFITNWVAYLTLKPVTDQGAGNSFEFLQLWDTVTNNSAQADVDMWLWEPDGRYWIPYLGSVTTNGWLTGESENTGAYHEGWKSYQIVDAGTYGIYAHQWKAPSNLTTVIDIAYRTTLSQNWSYLYGAGTYPLLNQTGRIEDDASASWAEANNGLYSNFKLIATWTPQAGSAAAGDVIADQSFSDDLGFRPVDGPVDESIFGDQAPTAEDMARLQQMIRERQRIREQEDLMDLGSEPPAALQLPNGVLPPPPARPGGNWN